MKPHLLCIGGEDHHLRIPFLLALGENGFRVSAVGSGDPAPFRQAGIAYQRIQLSRFINPVSDARAFRTLARLVRMMRPDLVQCFDTKLNVLVPLAARGVCKARVVSTINGLGWLYSSRAIVALALRPLYEAMQRRAARATALTVFQNRYDQASFLRRRLVGKTGRHVVIPGSGIDVARFEQAAASGPSPRDLRRALGLEEAEIVMTVTRLTREKGIPTLLAAAAQVHQRRPNVRFVLVGPRESEGRLAVPQAEIERHAPYVRAIGPRPDVPALLGIADIFAFPTELREGVPRALLEAAVAGCPIVTTRMPGCTDVICDGWNGLLVPPRAPEMLARKILDLLDDRRSARAMGARAAEFVRQEFNLAITVERYVAAYRDLLGASTRRPGGQIQRREITQASERRGADRVAAAGAQRASHEA